MKAAVGSEMWWEDPDDGACSGLVVVDNVDTEAGVAWVHHREDEEDTVFEVLLCELRETLRPGGDWDDDEDARRERAYWRHWHARIDEERGK